jgi:gluconolactonase
MRKFVVQLLAATAMGVGSAHAQGVVEKLDPALDALVAPDTKVEKIHEDDQFFEGPVWHHGAEGSFLTFSDLISNRVDKWDPKTKQVTDLYPKCLEGQGQLQRRSRKSATARNMSRSGRTARRSTRKAGSSSPRWARVRSCAARRTASSPVLADKYEGNHLNAPNDLVIKSDGSIYFTDIRANTKSSDFNPPEGVTHTGVYRIKDGKLELLVSDLEAPNGIAFSPDEKVLYVNDIRAKKVWRYDVAADGKISAGKIFIDMNSDTRPGLPDGMKVDVQGNVWDSGPGGIWIISPQGKHLGTILTPERLSNLAWGDDDGKTIYTTGGTMVTRIRVKVAGFRP